LWRALRGRTARQRQLGIAPRLMFAAGMAGRLAALQALANHPRLWAVTVLVAGGRLWLAWRGVWMGFGPLKNGVSLGFSLARLRTVIRWATG